MCGAPAAAGSPGAPRRQRLAVEPGAHVATRRNAGGEVDPVAGAKLFPVRGDLGVVGDHRQAVRVDAKRHDRRGVRRAVVEKADLTHGQRLVHLRKHQPQARRYAIGAADRIEAAQAAGARAAGRRAHQQRARRIAPRPGAPQRLGRDDERLGDHFAAQAARSDRLDPIASEHRLQRIQGLAPGRLEVGDEEQALAAEAIDLLADLLEAVAQDEVVLERRALPGIGQIGERVVGPVLGDHVRPVALLVAAHELPGRGGLGRKADDVAALRAEELRVGLDRGRRDRQPGDRGVDRGSTGAETTGETRAGAGQRRGAGADQQVDEGHGGDAAVAVGNREDAGDQGGRESNQDEQVLTPTTACQRHQQAECEQHRRQRFQQRLFDEEIVAVAAVVEHRQRLHHFGRQSSLRPLGGHQVRRPTFELDEMRGRVPQHRRADEQESEQRHQSAGQTRTRLAAIEEEEDQKQRPERQRHAAPGVIGIDRQCGARPGQQPVAPCAGLHGAPQPEQGEHLARRQDDGAPPDAAEETVPAGHGEECQGQQRHAAAEQRARQQIEQRQRGNPRQCGGDLDRLGRVPVPRQKGRDQVHERRLPPPRGGDVGRVGSPLRNVDRVHPVPRRVVVHARGNAVEVHDTKQDTEPEQSGDRQPLGSPVPGATPRRRLRRLAAAGHPARQRPGRRQQDQPGEGEPASAGARATELEGVLPPPGERQRREQDGEQKDSSELSAHLRRRLYSGHRGTAESPWASRRRRSEGKRTRRPRGLGSRGRAHRSAKRARGRISKGGITRCTCSRKSSRSEGTPARRRAIARLFWY